MSDLNSTDVETEVDTDVDTTNNEWTPPTKEEWDDLVARKSRADSEAASRKRWLRELGYDPKTGEKVPDDSETAPDIKLGPDYQDDAAKPVQADTAAIAKTAFSEGAAIVIALADAGVGPKSLDRVSRLIDRTEDVAPQIEALKEEFPELFKSRRTTNVADVSLAGGGRKKAPSADQAKDYAQVLADQVLGR